MNIIRSLQRKTECPFFYDYKTVQQALRFMRSHGCVQVPVVNQDGRYLGTVSEGDFLWHIIDWGGYEAAKDHKIAELLRRGAPLALKITAPDDELRRAALCGAVIPIVDDRGCLCGIVTRRSVILYLAEKDGWKRAETAVNE